jgi:tRNA pseudouridine55 synthase
VRPSADEIRAALPSFIGAIMQQPPIYSALKISGQRAYDLARAGETVELAPREVTITHLEYLDSPTPDTSRFVMACGKGTYVRALARDLAAKLGAYGHVSALRRTRSGPFSLESAISLENLEKAVHNDAAHTALLPLATALDDIPALAISESESQRLRHGGQLLNLAARNHPAGTVVLVTTGSQPVALATTNDMTLTPVRVFNL